MRSNELVPRIDRVEDLAAIRDAGPVMLAGPRDHVSALLRHVYDTGRVQTMTPPTRHTEGVAMVVTLLSATWQPATQPRMRRPVVAAAVSAGLALTAGAAWLVYAAVAWLAAHIGAVLVVAALLAVAAAAGPRTCKTVITVIHRH